MMAGFSSKDLTEGKKAAAPEAPVSGARAERSSLPEENLGLLPQGYDEDRLVVVPRDPRWLFLVWDLKRITLEESRREAPDGRMVLRLYVTDESGVTRSSDFDAPEGDGRLYARVPVPGVSVFAELGLSGPGDGWRPMVRSERTALAVDRVRSGPPRFATLPLDVPLPSTEMADGQSIDGVVELRLLTAEEVRRLFGEGVAGSTTTRKGE
ncbi:MAG: DUF4912 domain-containing protein [Deltaproteobacteria bacterium]|nr:DUF4912 domain-containing protein [Deltaproteobacteria bacterium]